MKRLANISKYIANISKYIYNIIYIPHIILDSHYFEHFQVMTVEEDSFQVATVNIQLLSKRRFKMPEIYSH